MLASITPLGERSRQQRWPVTVAAHALGGLVGGAAIGSAAAVVAGTHLPLDGRARLAFLALLLLMGSIVDLRIGGLRVPTHRRQVDERWLRRYRGWVYGGGFGVQLGTGLATTVTTAAVYVTLAGAALAPSVAVGCAIGAAFGLTRGLLPALTRRLTSPERLALFHRRLARHAASAALATALAQAALAAAAVAAVLR